jgi:hypothetical protein
LEGEANFTYNGSQTRISRNDTSTASGVFVNQAGTGDASFQVTAGAGNYSIGVDNSATSDPLKISASDALGTSDIMSFLTSGINVYTSMNFQDAYDIQGVQNISVITGINGNGTANIDQFDTINANTKNFDIVHPVKGSPWRLQYTSLEGPEAGVYLRGKTTEKVIELPDYWTGLVHEDSLTVQLTPIGSACIHYVVDVKDNQVHIDCQDGKPNCYFTIYGERKDVDGPKLEYIKE